MDISDHPEDWEEVLSLGSTKLFYRAPDDFGVDFELKVELGGGTAASDSLNLSSDWEQQAPSYIRQVDEEGFAGALYEAIQAIKGVGGEITVESDLQEDLAQLIEYLLPTPAPATPATVAQPSPTASNQQVTPPVTVVSSAPARSREDVRRQMRDIRFDWRQHQGIAATLALRTSRGKLFLRGILRSIYDFELILEMQASYDLSLLPMWEKTGTGKYTRSVFGSDFGNALYDAFSVINDYGAVEVAPGLHAHIQQAINLFFEPHQLAPEPELVVKVRQQGAGARQGLQEAQVLVNEYEGRRVNFRERVLQLQGEIEITSRDYSQRGHRYDPASDGMLQQVQQAQAALADVESTLRQYTARRDELQAKVDGINTGATALAQAYVQAESLGLALTGYTEAWTRSRRIWGDEDPSSIREVNRKAQPLRDAVAALEKGASSFNENALPHRAHRDDLESVLDATAQRRRRLGLPYQEPSDSFGQDLRITRTRVNNLQTQANALAGPKAATQALLDPYDALIASLKTAHEETEKAGVLLVVYVS
jgi:hypothetical protein